MYKVRPNNFVISIRIFLFCILGSFSCAYGSFLIHEKSLIGILIVMTGLFLFSTVPFCFESRTVYQNDKIVYLSLYKNKTIKFSEIYDFSLDNEREWLILYDENYKELLIVRNQKTTNFDRLCEDVKECANKNRGEQYV